MPIYQQLVAFFEADDWPFAPLTDQPALRTGFSGANGKWMCYAHVREEVEQAVFYSVMPVNVPSSKLALAAEFITRANYGMMIGNFEMNYDDGEVRYKTSIDVEGSELTFPLIKQMVYANVTTMDRYLPGFMSVIYADVPPTEAIGKIEREEKE